MTKRPKKARAGGLIPAIPKVIAASEQMTEQIISFETPHVEEITEVMNGTRKVKRKVEQDVLASGLDLGEKLVELDVPVAQMPPWIARQLVAKEEVDEVRDDEPDRVERARERVEAKAKPNSHTALREEIEREQPIDGDRRLRALTKGLGYRMNFAHCEGWKAMRQHIDMASPITIEWAAKELKDKIDYEVMPLIRFLRSTGGAAKKGAK